MGNIVHHRGRTLSSDLDEIEARELNQITTTTTPRNNNSRKKKMTLVKKLLHTFGIKGRGNNKYEKMNKFSRQMKFNRFSSKQIKIAIRNIFSDIGMVYRGKITNSVQVAAIEVIDMDHEFNDSNQKRKS
ncbi:hypothetical protein FRX31_020432 [Thalictrum thalictroides]|uniref:Uncharacterized protein n=1 Tax=Thalictrum thalictroides TaxID=46969 RepID=A0A7J6VXZ0_THATH|nr:hypothetical protein FRX31_020432 [Thalictrum thalictroides]